MDRSECTLDFLYIRSVFLEAIIRMLIMLRTPGFP